jgi:5-methylcytosine-specific restriction endonuclease McrA
LALSNKALGSKKWKDLRLRVLARDGKVCYLCQGEADQVDHIIARTKMGDMWDMENLAAVCRSCNLKKGNKKLSVFLKKESTPPVFPDSSLPETRVAQPDSPFSKP